MIIKPKDHMPTFTVREPEKGPPIYVGDFYEHPTHTGVVVIDVQLDERSSPRERVITYRAATRQDLEDHGML